MLVASRFGLNNVQILFFGFLALMALGFKQPDAATAIQSAQAMLGGEASVEDLIRVSLKRNTPP